MEIYSFAPESKRYHVSNFEQDLASDGTIVRKQQKKWKSENIRKT